MQTAQRFLFSFSVAGLFFWASGIVVAQVDVDPIPDCVAEDDDDTTYQATVTCDYDFYFNLKVYHNGQLRHNTTDSVVNDGPSIVYHKLVSFTGWGLREGDTLLFVGKASISEGRYRGMSDTANLTVTVDAAGECNSRIRKSLRTRVRPDRAWRLLAIREESA